MFLLIKSPSNPSNSLKSLELTALQTHLVKVHLVLSVTEFLINYITMVRDSEKLPTFVFCLLLLSTGLFSLKKKKISAWKEQKQKNTCKVKAFCGKLTLSSQSLIFKISEFCNKINIWVKMLDFFFQLNLHFLLIKVFNPLAASSPDIAVLQTDSLGLNNQRDIAAGDSIYFYRNPLNKVNSVLSSHTA